MFNAPRSRSSAFPSNFTSSNFDPLAQSAAPSYMDSVDPWSGVPSPSATPAPPAAGGMAASTPNLGAGVGGYERPVQAMSRRMSSGFGSGGAVGSMTAGLAGGMISPGGGTGFASLDRPAGGNGTLNSISESNIPSQYILYWDSLDLDGSGLISLPSLNRLLSTSSLPALTNEKILTQVIPPSAQSITRKQFFTILGLVALAQGGKDVSLERLESSRESMPVPSLRISSAAGTSLPAASGSSYGSPSPLIKADKALQHPTPIRAYSANSTNGFPGFKEPSNSSPWDLPASRETLGTHEESRSEEAVGTEVQASGYEVNGNEEVPGMRKGWFNDVEKVDVTILAEKEGWFLQKYRLESDKRTHGTVTRRYSDFVWLLDCLTKRYPFRMLPHLPPKRMGPDQAFLEQRRKGLQRFINFVVNHPILKEDGCLGVFLSEPNFEGWRKRSKVNLDEESTQKKLDPAAEARIPGNVDQRIDVMRRNINTLLESHAKLVVLAERSVKRIESASADQSRMAMTLASLGESCPQSCWRNADSNASPSGLGGAGCDLCKGVGRGFVAVGDAWGKEAEDAERRTMALTLGSIETLKSQRDLYASFKELLARNDRLSRDNVDVLRKSVDTKQKKLEVVRDKRKPNWEVEEEKLSSAIAQETSTIEGLMTRRVYIKHCLWHELSVVLHSQQAAQATLGWRTFAENKTLALRGATELWKALSTRLGEMPVE